MMKKIINIIFTVFLFTLASCSDITGGIKESKKAHISISTSLSQVNKAGSRTVFPDFMKDGDLTGFSFWFESARWTHFGLKPEIAESFNSVEELSQGLYMDAGTYDFWLYAEKGNASMVCELNDVWIDEGENNLLFTLINLDIYDYDPQTEEKGSVLVTLDFSGVEDPSCVKYVTGELSEIPDTYSMSTEKETAFKNIECYSFSNYDQSGYSAVFSASDVKNGVYRLKLRFFSDEEKTKLLNTYRELVLVNGGEQSSAERSITHLNTTGSSFSSQPEPDPDPFPPDSDAVNLHAMILP